MSQARDEASDSWQSDDDEATGDGLFGLPPDHVVVALRGRTGQAHLGWRRPSVRERLRCAALLASEQFRRDELSAAESFALSNAPAADGIDRATALLRQVMSGEAGKVGGIEAVSAVLAVEELLSVLHATQAGYLARLAEPGVVGDPARLAAAPKSRTAERTSTLNGGGTSEPEILAASHHLAAGQLGAVLCVGPGAAAQRIAAAEDLINGPQAVRVALLAGSIDPRRARVLLDRTAVLSFADRTDVAERLVPLAPDCTPSRWAAIVEAAVIAADPVGAEERRRQAVERRRLRLDRGDDGMAKFIAELTAPDAQLAWDVFEAVGKALEGMDDRCADHRRADAFATMIELLAAGETVSVADLIALAVAQDHETCCGNSLSWQGDDQETVVDEFVAGGEETVVFGDLDAEPETGPQHPGEGESADVDVAQETGVVAGAEFRGRSDGAEWESRSCTVCSGRSAADRKGTAAAGRSKKWKLPIRQGRRTHLTVVVTLDALAALVDDPAALDGHGAITAGMARTLAEAASSVSLIVGEPESGAVIGAGEWTYRPRQDVRDQVLALYRTCVFTGCGRRAVDSQLDHREEFCLQDPEAGGPTSRRNLFALCRLHHRLKTFGGWSYRPGDRTVEFRSPLGLTSITRNIDPVVLQGLRPVDPDPPDDPPPF